MGIFDKMFGRGASTAAEAPNAERRFAELKTRYAPVLDVIQHENVRLENLHVQDNKLFVKGVAPSEQARMRVMERIDRSGGDDILPDLRVEAGQVSPATEQGQRYTVKAGDTLSKIAQEFYGDGTEYMRIFYANRDQLTDPNLIKVGQTLVIPPDTDE